MKERTGLGLRLARAISGPILLKQNSIAVGGARAEQESTEHD